MRIAMASLSDLVAEIKETETILLHCSDYDGFSQVYESYRVEINLTVKQVEDRIDYLKKELSEYINREVGNNHSTQM